MKPVLSALVRQITAVYKHICDPSCRRLRMNLSLRTFRTIAESGRTDVEIPGAFQILNPYNPLVYGVLAMLTVSRVTQRTHTDLPLVQTARAHQHPVHLDTADDRKCVLQLLQGDTGRTHRVRYHRRRHYEPGSVQNHINCY